MKTVFKTRPLRNATNRTGCIMSRQRLGLSAIASLAKAEVRPPKDFGAGAFHSVLDVRCSLFDVHPSSAFLIPLVCCLTLLASIALSHAAPLKVDLDAKARRDTAPHFTGWPFDSAEPSRSFGGATVTLHKTGSATNGLDS